MFSNSKKLKKTFQYVPISSTNQNITKLKHVIYNKEYF